MVDTPPDPARGIDGFVDPSATRIESTRVMPVVARTALTSYVPGVDGEINVVVATPSGPQITDTGSLPTR